MTVNIQKSELVKVGDAGNGRLFAAVLECQEVSLPIKYLGLPLGAKYKISTSWDPVVDMYERRLAT